MKKIIVKITENGYSIKSDTNPLITVEFLKQAIIEHSLHIGKSLEETRESFNKEIDKHKGTKKKKEEKKPY